MSKEFDISLVTDQQIVDAVEDKLTNYKKGLPREEVFVAAERFVQEMALPNAYRESSIIYISESWRDSGTDEHEIYMGIIDNLKPSEKVSIQKSGKNIAIKLAKNALKAAEDKNRSVNNVAGTNHEVPGDPVFKKHSMVAGIRGGTLSPEDPRLNTNNQSFEIGDAYES